MVKYPTHVWIVEAKSFNSGDWFVVSDNQCTYRFFGTRKLAIRGIGEYYHRDTRKMRVKKWERKQ